VRYKTIYLQENPDLIPLIANWYHSEWNIPIETSINGLKEKLNKKIPLQLVVFLDETPVATGGLYEKVRLLDVEPKFKQYGPWLALLYTVPSYRGKGIGAYLCRSLDAQVVKQGLAKYYLYTYTAGRFYVRQGWNILENIVYKSNYTVVMYKDLNVLQPGL